MGIAPECSLVVKHTFLEFVKTPDQKSNRARAFTDTELLESAGLIIASTTGTPAAEPLVEPSPVCGPAAWPMTPMLEPIFEPEMLPQQCLGFIDYSATMEIKSMLGMDMLAEDGVDWLPPAAALPDDMQDASWAQHPWVFVPFPDFAGDYSECCAAAQGGACWVEPGMWEPATSSTASTGAGSAVDASSTDGFDGAAGESRTTVMLRNLPNTLTRDMLLQHLDSVGFTGQFDLVYIPVDFSTGAGLGYAFINMIAPASVNGLWEAFDGLASWSVDSDKVCTVSWSDPHQGLNAHIERYRNSPVMHPDVPDEWKPALFVNGVRVEFPAPTKKLKAPKVRSKKVEAM